MPNLKFIMLASSAVVLLLLPLQNAWNSEILLVWSLVWIAYGAATYRKISLRNIANWPYLLACILVVVMTALTISGSPLYNQVITLALTFALIPAFKIVSLLVQPRQLAIVFIAVVTIHAAWAVAQFSAQTDLAMQHLGETNLVQGQTGIANFSPLKLFRAYGPYPHPNSLAASAIMALLALLVYRLVPIFHYLFFTLSLSIALAFSRAGWLAWLATAGISRLTYIGRKRFAHIFVVSFIIILSLLPLIAIRLSDNSDSAFSERLDGYKYSLDIIRSNGLIYGTGIGGYQSSLVKYLSTNNISTEPWQITPVHSAPLMFIAEWGVLPALGFTILILTHYWQTVKKRWLYLVPLLPLLLLDHYFYTQLAPLVYLVVFMQLLEPPTGRYTSKTWEG